MRVIGLTGGIASGKSTVGQLLKSWGIPVIDADQVARALLQPNAPTLNALVAELGPAILDANGALDRQRMRAAISSDPSIKATLDRITHPAIRDAIAARIGAIAARGNDVAVVEAALLVETGGYKMYPQLIVVSCTPDLQLERLMSRDGMQEASARALVATQLPLADKEAVATVVIRNNHDAATLEEDVRRAWEQLGELQ